jgi:hypothetical protein
MESAVSDAGWEFVDGSVHRITAIRLAAVAERN